MFTTHVFNRPAISLMAMLILTIGLSACGGSSGGGAKGVTTVPATIMLGNSVTASAPASGFVTRVSESCGNVDTDTIDSLFIDITRIDVHHAGSNGDDSDDEVEIDDDTSTSLDPDDEDVDSSGWITVFEAETPDDVKTVDVIDLQFLSEVLTSMNLPVGKYTKVSIYYENPVLTIGGIEQTDVKTTANGRIFISQNFTIPDDGPVLIMINFNAICLTLTGEGTYIINPQLIVDISLTSAEVEIEGLIVGITLDPKSIAVFNGETVIDVSVVVTDPADPRDTEIVREIEEDVFIPITFADLMIGDKVKVEGLLKLDGSIIAHRIEVEMLEVVPL